MTKRKKKGARRGDCIATPKRRRRCPRGHLIDKRKKTHCVTCWQLFTEKGRTNRRKRQALHYCRRVMNGMTTAEAKYHIVLPQGDVSMDREARDMTRAAADIETQRRLAAARESHCRAKKKYYERWGRPSENFVHAYRRDMIKSGEWTEEHPL